MDERSDAACAARIPPTVGFQEKWRLALTLLRRTRAAGLTLTAVVADAEYGDNRTVRQTQHRLRLPYAQGISPTLTVFRGTPTLRIDRTQPRPRNRSEGWPDQEPLSVRTLSEAMPARRWRRVAWRNGTQPPWEADFAALRVTPASDWRHRRLAPEVWLLCERGLGPTGRRKHYVVSLPTSASLTQLVRLAHQRWAIEQHYQDLKSALGLDHFEGRSQPGWQHHMVISAVAYAFLQTERMRPRAGPRLTFPQARAFVQEVFGGAGVSRRLAIGGELSIASPVTLTTVESHSSYYATRTMTHRDTILVALLRVRTGRFVDVVGGGGIVFPRTSLTVSGWTGGPSGGQVPFGPLAYESPSKGARPALTVGVDLAAPLHKHFAICGVVRLHHLSRAAPLRSAPFGKANDVRPFLQPGANVIRAGVGVRIIL